MPEDEEIDLSPDEEKGWLGKIKDSIYENWQTILVALVVLIVGISAYNYNEKTGVNNSNSQPATEQTAESSQQTEQAPANTDQEQDQEQDAEKKDEAAAQQQDQQANQQATTENQAATENKDAAKQTNPTETNKEENKAASDQTKTEAKNTGSVAVEGENYKAVAVKGDGLTHLARKALSKYLEENKDDQITDLHKIYIEDYLRKQAGNSKGKIRVGHEETFSKSTIEKAIASSKKLSQKSLDNLKKYSTVQ